MVLVNSSAATVIFVISTIVFQLTVFFEFYKRKKLSYKYIVILNYSGMPA